ncbi:uncharacterized protein J3R85_014824 [Psidium guajava]|nr:uncharacterized protein J3R85_014824 [Psidium guajava]
MQELPLMGRNKVASNEPNSSEAKIAKVSVESNVLFKKKSQLLMSVEKNKPRLLDPPDLKGKKLGRISKLGLSPNRHKDEDDFFSKDLPEQ